MILDVPSKPEFYDSMNVVSAIINKNIINQVSLTLEKLFHSFVFLRT